MSDPDRVAADPAGELDRERVAELLGRQPQGHYEVVVRRPDGWPVVLRNAPLLDSGRPMPTRYWLVDRELNRHIGRLESEGGVDRAEAEVDPGALERAHAAYARERDADLPAGHTGPRPTGGVGGTRVGVKCLHAHYANHLAGADDPVGRWVDDRLPLALRSAGRAAVTSGPVAVVEIGSGSVKLVVAGSSGPDGQPVELDRLAVRTRLHDGDGRTLDPQGLTATGRALESFAAVLAEAGPAATVAVATAVGRTAADADRLGDLCRQALGIDLDVLSGGREAALALRGATAGRAIGGPVAVVDIGSGSTEFALRAGDGTVATHSLPVGARVLTSNYLTGDPPRPEELSSALSVAELHLDDLRRELAGLQEVVEDGVLIGVGAVTEIAAVEIGLADPDASVDGYRLTKPAVEEVFRALATEAAADRAHNPGLKPEHVDDIVGALCILVEFLRRFGVDQLLVSERDVGYGLAAELIAGG